jgi:hypothetical protein
MQKMAPWMGGHEVRYRIVWFITGRCSDVGGANAETLLADLPANQTVPLARDRY